MRGDKGKYRKDKDKWDDGYPGCRIVRMTSNQDEGGYHTGEREYRLSRMWVKEDEG
jgi:hypothetical protein